MPRIKTFLLFGQSNAEGRGDGRDMSIYLWNPHILEPAGSQRPPVYPGILAYQNDHGMDMNSGLTTPIGAADGRSGTFRPMTLDADLTDFGQEYDSNFNGYHYNNTRSFPRKSYVLPFHGQREFGPELQLAWEFYHFFGEPIAFVKLAIGSTYVSRYDVHNTATAPVAADAGDYSWFDDDWFGDWTPGKSNDLDSAVNLASGFYSSLTARNQNVVKTGPDPDRDIVSRNLYWMFIENYVKTGAVAAAAEYGLELDIQAIFSVLGESETSQQGHRHIRAAQNMREIKEAMRRDIYDAGLTTLARDEIPFIITSPMPVDAYPEHEAVDAQYQEIANEDPYVGHVTGAQLEAISSTAGVPITKAGAGGYNGTDLGHYNGAACLELGRLHYNAFLSIHRGSQVALPRAEERYTLSEIRDRVLRRFERNTRTTNAKTAHVNQFINDAIEHIHNKVGDVAFWLRRIITMSIDASPTEAFALPHPVRRLLRIERTRALGIPVRYHLIGFRGEGRMHIRFEEPVSGEVDIHHIWLPPRLTEDDQKIPVPREFTEAVVVEAARRLAQSGGAGKALEISLTAEARERIRDVRSVANKTDRARNEDFHRFGRRNVGSAAVLQGFDYRFPW